MRELGYRLEFFCNEAETADKHTDYEISVPKLIAAIEQLSG